MKRLLTVVRRGTVSLLVLVLMLTAAVPVAAVYHQGTTTHNSAEFTYELILTDQYGAAVTNPRELAAGDTVYVEIRLTKNDTAKTTYNGFGIEFRLLTRGLSFNNDGATMRNGTQVRLDCYNEGDAVGFAWYDLSRKGEAFANPVLAGSWSYTVQDPSMVNITVPVALVYVNEKVQEHIPVGNARLYLDVNGGELLGEDVSGEYLSGTKVTLPNAKNGELAFEGWSDGVKLYPAGAQYTVSGVVTLTAQWQEPVRDRLLTLMLDGGELLDDDVSGLYAVGEVVVLPDIRREGFTFIGWSDGTNIYPPGAEIVMMQSVTLKAIWEPVIEDAPDVVMILATLGLVMGLLGLLLLFLLWKRSFVKYSLVNGDIALSFKDHERDVMVEVVLCDGEKEYHLNKSGLVPAKQRLKYIKNENMPIAEVETGTYKGKLIITDGSTTEVKKCRIKVLDRELEE